MNLRTTVMVGSSCGSPCPTPDRGAHVKLRSTAALAAATLAFLSTVLALAKGLGRGFPVSFRVPLKPLLGPMVAAATAWIASPASRSCFRAAVMSDSLFHASILLPEAAIQASSMKEASALTCSALLKECARSSTNSTSSRESHSCTSSVAKPSFSRNGTISLAAAMAPTGRSPWPPPWRLAARAKGGEGGRRGRVEERGGGQGESEPIYRTTYM